jgi:hypothetical protein
MTQIGRYSHLMKVNITKVRAHIAIHFDLRGSVLAQTIQAGCPKVVTSYHSESPDDQAKVAAVLRNARHGCGVRAAVTNPVPFEDAITLNGQALSIAPFRPAGRDKKSSGDIRS